MSYAEIGGLSPIPDTPGREFGASSHLAEGGLFNPLNGPQTRLPRIGIPVLSPVKRPSHPFDQRHSMIEHAWIHNHDNVVNIICIIRRPLSLVESPHDHL